MIYLFRIIYTPIGLFIMPIFEWGIPFIIIVLKFMYSFKWDPWKDLSFRKMPWPFWHKVYSNSYFGGYNGNEWLYLSWWDWVTDNKFDRWQDPQKFKNIVKRRKVNI